MKLFKWKKVVKEITFCNEKDNYNLNRLVNYDVKRIDNTLFMREQNERESISENNKNSNFLFLKEYIVNEKDKSDDVNINNSNLLNKDSIKKIYLSSNNSDEIKFYSIDYSNEENRDNNFNKNNNIRFSIIKNSKIRSEMPLKTRNLVNSRTISPKRILSSLSPKFSRQFVNVQDNNNSIDNLSPRRIKYNKELDNLFSKIRPLMKEKYFEYKELLREFNLWEDNGFKNGIQFFRKKDNNEFYSTIRGIIEIDLNKENDLFYENLYKKKINIERNYHLSDLITSKELVNYIWSSDPLSYDNTVDKSYRVHTWDDGNPGYCIYYHSYKGSLGVQGREFLLFGYKDDSDPYYYDNSSKRTSYSINSICSPVSPVLSQSSIKDIFNNVGIDNSSKISPKSNTSNQSIDQINNNVLLKSRKKFKRNKRTEKISNLMSNQEKIIESSFFISSDLSEELSNDYLFNSIKQNNTSTSFISANCYLNGIKVDKILKNDDKRFLRMDILWIGDLNGKLPEFLKRTLLSLSLSTMKVLKDNFMELKKKELINIFKDSHLNHKT